MGNRCSANMTSQALVVVRLGDSGTICRLFRGREITSVYNEILCPVIGLADGCHQKTDEITAANERHD